MDRICTAFILLWCCCLIAIADTDLTRLKRCHGDERVTYGNTYDLREGHRWWSHCKFYNPLVEVSLCGRPINYTHQYWLCDPDRLLTRHEAYDVDRKLYTAKEVTPYQCQDTRGRWENYTIGVVMIDKLRVSDLSSPDLCMNLCQELLPEVNYTARSPTPEELVTTAQNFANYILRSWKLGGCGNDIIIFYSKQYQLLATAVGERASKSLTASFIQSTQDAASGYFRSGDPRAGLLYLIQAYQSGLQGFTPAKILLVLNFVLMMLALAFFGYQHSLGFDIGGAFDDTVVRKGLRRITYLLMGLYLVEWTFVAVEWISEKWRALTLLGVMALSLSILLVLGLVGNSGYQTTSSVNTTGL